MIDAREEGSFVFKEMYLHLFNRVTDALEALEAGNAARAKALLIAAQQECEARYIGEDFSPMTFSRSSF